MAFYALDSTGLSHFWDKFKARLLPAVTSSDSGKTAQVNSNGAWALANPPAGVSSATINSSGHLILTLTNGTPVDAGDIVSAVLAQLVAAEGVSY